MKSLAFPTRLIFCCTLTIFIATLMFSMPSHAQSPAKEEFNKAIAFFDDGKARFNVSDLRGAIGQWEKALTIFKKHKQKQAISATTGNLGNAYSTLGNYRKAIGYYEQALTISNEIGDKVGKGNHLGELGTSTNSWTCKS
jgi:tetratricopeptide (TPR) repeat protein